MNIKKIALATAVASAMGGLYGCASDGDEAIINIDSTVTNNTTNEASGSAGGDSTVSENCPSWAGAKDKRDGVDVCSLPATITENRTLTSDIIWLMEGRVTVGNGNREMSVVEGTLEDGQAVLNVTLTINEGTQVQGVKGSFANLLITRGSKINAVGSASNPIVFSSDDDDLDGAGEWGGLIIQGYGLHNECLTANEGTVACNVDSEGESGFGGGYTVDDDSGTLSYVVVTEGGFEFAPGNEINGISLIGVGSGTSIDHIQVNANADDGIEFYGGNVNVKYMVLTGNIDDSVDWDEGYQGNIQYVIVKQSAETGGNAIEADTEGTLDFLSKPTIANGTFIGNGDETELFVFKKSSGAFVHNSVGAADTGSVINECVKVDGSGANANVGTALVLNNFVSGCTQFAVDGDGNSIDGNFDTTTVFQVDPALDANYAATAAEAQLSAPIDWSAVNGAFSESVADESFLDATDYAGAVDPAGNDNWYEGWIVEGSL